MMEINTFMSTFEPVGKGLIGSVKLIVRRDKDKEQFNSQ